MKRLLFGNGLDREVNRIASLTAELHATVAALRADRDRLVALGDRFEGRHEQSFADLETRLQAALDGGRRTLQAELDADHQAFEGLRTTTEQRLAALQQEAGRTLLGASARVEALERRGAQLLEELKGEWGRARQDVERLQQQVQRDEQRGRERVDRLEVGLDEAGRRLSAQGVEVEALRRDLQQTRTRVEFLQAEGQRGRAEQAARLARLTGWVVGIGLGLAAAVALALLW